MGTLFPPPPCVEDHNWPEDTYQSERVLHAENIRRSYRFADDAVIRTLKKDYGHILAIRGRIRCGRPSAHRLVITGKSINGISVTAVASPVLDVKQQFYKLADEWEQETQSVSSIPVLTSHPSYRRIIKLGWNVVPFLLLDLQMNRRFWFPALNEITGIRPFDPSDAGDSERMLEAWVRWGKKKQLI